MTFSEFLRSLGLRPGNIRADGKIHRCATDAKPRRKNGAYLLQPDEAWGWGQDWTTMESPAHWKDESAPAPDLESMRRRAEQRDARLREARAATEEARKFYAMCPPLRGGHPYLDAHGLDMRGCVGLRLDAKGRLVVPMLHGRTMVSVQRIAEDGDKKFWRGAPAGGCYYTIDRAHATVTVFCEGLATGLALYSSIPNARVVVCFTASNMQKVAERSKVSGLVVVAADNDYRTVCQRHKPLEQPFEPWDMRPDWCRCNPGRHYAEKAAEWLECGVAIPQCNGTDFCDLRTERIIERAMRAGEYETPGRIALEVEGLIGIDVMRHAEFRAPKAVAS